MRIDLSLSRRARLASTALGGPLGAKLVAQAGRRGRSTLTEVAEGASGSSTRAIVFEALEQRILLSADINPALGALAVENDDGHALSLHALAEDLSAATAPEIDLAAAATPAEAAPLEATASLFTLETALDATTAAPPDGARALGFQFAADLDPDSARTEETFTVDLLAGDKATLLDRSAGGPGFRVAVTGPDGADLGLFDPTGGEQFLFDAVTSGIYTLDVQWVDGPAGRVDLSLFTNVAVEGDTDIPDGVDGARSLAPGTLAFHGGARALGLGDVSFGDADVWSFDVSGADTVTVVATPITGRSNTLTVELLDSSGDRLAMVENFDGDATVLQGVDLTGSGLTGPLSVRVSDRNFGGDVAYSLLVLRNATIEADATRNNVDFFNFDGEEASQPGRDLGAVTTALGGLRGVSGATIDEFISAFEPDGELGFDFNLTGLDFGVGGTSTAYGEIGDFQIFVDESVQFVDGEFDLFEVALAAGDTLTAEIFAERFESDLDSILTIFDSSGVQVAQNDDFEGLDPRVSFTADFDDLYYVGVSGFSNYSYDPFDPFSGEEGSSTGFYDLVMTKELAGGGAGGGETTDVDHFRFAGGEGETITVYVEATGIDADGDGEDFAPLIVVSDGSGAEIARSVEDGRLVSVSFDAPETGVYEIALSSTAGAGAYLLRVDGAAPPPGDAFLDLSSADYSHGNPINFRPTGLFFFFAEPVFGPGLDPADLLIDGAPAEAVLLSGSNRIFFDVGDAFAEGTSFEVSLAEGAVRSFAGAPSEGATYTVTLDDVAPTLVASDPADGGSVEPGADAIRVTFDETMNPSSFRQARLFEALTGVSTTLFTESIVPVDGDPASFDILLDAPLQEGVYSLTLLTGFFDFAFNSAGAPVIDFVVDITERDLTDAFAPLEPAAGLAYRAASAGAISSAEDVDRFTADLEAGQSLALVITPTDGLTLSVTLTGPDGATVGTAMGAAPGAPLIVEGLPIETAGVYTAVVTSAGVGVGVFEIEALLNATPTDGGAPRATEPAFQPLTGGGERAFFVGATPSTLPAITPIASPAERVYRGGDVESIAGAFAVFDGNYSSDYVLELRPDATEDGLARAFWTVNIGGNQNAELSFSFESTLSSTFTGEDIFSGVSVEGPLLDSGAVMSGDGGATWTPLFAIDETGGGDNFAGVDLGFIAQSAGFNLFDDIIISFQAYDPEGAGGFVRFDDAEVADYTFAGVSYAYEGFDGGFGLVGVETSGDVAVVDSAGRTALRLNNDFTSDFQLSQADWTLDLSGVETPLLRFEHSSFETPLPFPEAPFSFTGAHDASGVAVSVDGGATFNAIWSHGSTTTPETGSIDLAAALAAYGLNADGEVVVRFQSFTSGSGGETFVDPRIETEEFPAAPVHAYEVALEAGQLATFALSDQAGMTGSVLSLLSPSGALLALSQPYRAADQAIEGFVARETGVHTLLLTGATGQPGGRYGLALTRDIGIETGRRADDGGVAFGQDLGDRPADADGVRRVLGNLSGGARSGGGGTIEVALLTDFGGQAGFNEMLAQLEDSTEYNFDVTLLTPDEADELDELTPYDVVILSNSGNSNVDRFAQVAPGITAYAEQGGNVVITGWTVFASTSEAAATREAMNRFSPVTIGASYSFDANLTINEEAHPVTDGLNGVVLSGFNIEATTGTVHPDAIVLGSSSAGRPALAVRELDDGGRTVYLGTPHAWTSQLGLRNTGPADQLFEQAVAWAGGGSGANRYSVAATGGQTLVVTTQTPLDADGAAPNALNPQIEIIGPDGVSLLAAGTGGADDGKNVMLNYVVPQGRDGVYTIVVSGEDDGDGGYVLSIVGANPEAAALTAAITAPPSDAVVTVLPTSYTVRFSAPVLLSTVEAGDLRLTVGDTEVAADVVAAPTAPDVLTFRFDAPPVVEGVYTLSMADGAIESLGGGVLDGFTHSFTLDALGPNVTGTTPGEGGVLLREDTLAISITFSEQLAADGLGVEDVTLINDFTGETVALLPEDFAYDAGTSVLTLTLQNPEEGAYTLSLAAGPDGFRDRVDNPLNAGTGFTLGFFIDEDVDGDVPAPSFAAVRPLGGFVYTAQIEGAVHDPSDEDAFLVVLDAGQALSVRLDAGGDLRAGVRVETADGGVVLATAQAGDPATPVLLDGVDTGAAGGYRIVVFGVDGTGGYALGLTLNAGAEAESAGGAANDGAGGEQDIDGTLLPLADNVDRLAVRGALSTDGDAADRYAFTLVEGQRVSLVAALDDGDAQDLPLTMRLLGADGALLALGEPAVNAEQGIYDFVASATGTYVVVLESDAAPGAYTLVATRGALFERDGLDAPHQDITDQTTVVGGFGFAGGSDDGGRIAVVQRLSGSQAGFQRMAAQLSDSTVYGFDVSLISPNEADTLEELLAYDAVVIANDGTSSQSNDGFALMAAALRDYVELGGGVVATGWTVYGAGDDGAARSVLNEFLPVNVSGSSTNTTILTPNDVEHPVTEGIEPFSLSWVEYPFGGINEGAVVLANGPNVATVAVREVGSGRSVYVGVTYPSSGTTSAYTTGEPDQLLEQAVAWAARGDGLDRYSIRLEEGQTLRVETVTPLDGDGEPENEGDLRLQLLNANGAVIAANNDGAADDRNAVLIYSVPEGEAGAFELTVSRQSGSNASYLLRIDGIEQATNAAPVVVAAVPAFDSRLGVAPSELVLEFSEAIAPGAVSADALTFDDEAVVVTGVTQVNGRTLVFTLDAPDAEAVYTYALAEGALTDLQGVGNAAFMSSYVIDETAPWVASVSPDAQASAPFTQVQFIFDEALDPDSVQIADITAFTGPDGQNLLFAITDVSVDDATVTVSFSQQFQQGAYTFSIGPDITDVVGNAMADPEGGSAVFTTTIALQSPDLTVEIIDAPEAAQFGETIEISFRVTNVGADPVLGDWWDEVVLATSPGNSFGTLLIQQLRPTVSESNNPIPPLLAGDSYVVTFEATIPLDSASTPGTRFINVRTDEFFQRQESDETNNTDSVAIALSLPPLPDLVVSDVVIPESTLSGQQTPIQWTITNEGAAPATGTWTDYVSLSSDDNPDTVQQVFSFSFTGSIAPGASVTRIQNITVPDGFTGDQWVVVQTDRFNQIIEEAEGDNNIAISPGPMAVTLRPVPNLVVTAVTPPETGFSSQSITVEYEIANIGDGPTNASLWYDYAWLSTDQIFGNEDDVYLGLAINPAFLAAGESYRGSITGTLDRGIEGERYVFIQTDAFNGVNEFGAEDDNVSAPAAFEVRLTPPPDLIVSNVAHQDQAFSGTGFEVTWTVLNDGPGRTLETFWTDSVYLSADAEIDAGDILLGSLNHAGALDAGESYTTSLNVRLPIGVSGDFFLLVRADNFRQVYEFVDEDNNDGVDLADGAPDPLEILLTPPPDLEVRILDVSDPLLSGRSQFVTYEVFNAGATATPNTSWVDAIYLSDDDVLDASDRLLIQYRHYGPLQAGELYERTVGITLPNGLVGDQHLIAVTDTLNEVFELNFDFNTWAEAVEVGKSNPDLTIASFLAPETGEAGGAIGIDWRVENIGDGDTVVETWLDRIVISRDDTLGNGDDIILGEFGRNGVLAPAAGYDRSSVAVQLPFDLEGVYNLFVVADGRNAVFEDGEKANNASAPLLITIRRDTPDLTPSAIAMAGPDETDPDAVTAGQSLTVSFRVDNAGAGQTDASIWYDGVYLSTDDALSTDDIFLGDIYRGSRLAAGDGYGAEAQLTVPVSVAAGAYRVLVSADRRGAVTEDGAETNNVAASAGTIAVRAYDGGAVDGGGQGDPFAGLEPNLTIGAVTAPTSAFAGDVIEVSWTVTNEGDDPTGARIWRDALYLSLDQVFDSSDIYLGLLSNTENLGPDLSYTATLSVGTPTGVAGRWFIVARTDVYREIAETEEADNTALASVAIDLALPPPSDLVVGAYRAPATANPGQLASFTYEVVNEGDRAALGRWNDALYLSTDTVWDIDDAFIGEVAVVGPVEPGESYTRTLTTATPGVLPGDYYVIVRSDIRNTTPEEREDNNEGSSQDQAASDATPLPLGGEATGVLGRGQSAYFKLVVPDGETVRISVDRASEAASSELFVLFDGIPTRARFDAASSRPFAPDQAVTIPTTQGGEYFVLLNSPSGVEAEYAIRAETVPFSVETVSADTLGTTGEATLRIEGARFDADTTFTLVSESGEATQATRVHLSNSLLAFATFNLTAIEEGVYALLAARPGADPITVDDAVTITDAAGPARIAVNITGPAQVRPDRLNTFQLNFTNRGGGDTRAPLLLVTSETNTPMGLSPETVGVGTLHVLGVDREGPTDLYRPDAETSVSVLYRSGSAAQGVRINARAITADNTEVVEDWSAIERQIRPADIDDLDWNPFWARVQPRIGETYGDYVNFLNDVSAIVAEDGDPVRDVRALMKLIYENQPDFLPTVFFSGAVVDSQTGEGIGGVTVGAFERVGDEVIDRGSVETAEDGSFRFETLGPGAYTLVLSNRIETEDGFELAETQYDFDLDRDGVVDGLPVSVILADGEDTLDVTLSVAEIVTVTEENERAPLLATDADGRLHLVYYTEGGLVHSVLDEGSWTVPTSIPGSADAGEAVFVIDPLLLEGGREGLLVAWIIGSDNAAEIVYAVGERGPDGTYRWSDPVPVTQDGVEDSGLAFGVGANGLPTFLFNKSDAGLELDDRDVYAAVLTEIEPVFPEWSLEDLGLTESDLAGLSDAELAELASVSFTRSLGSIGFDDKKLFGLKFGAKASASASVKASAKSASASVSGNGSLTLGYVTGSLGVSGGLAWGVEDCEWQFQNGRLTLSGGVGAKIPVADIFARVPLPPVAIPAQLFGAIIAVLFDISVTADAKASATATYTEGNQLLLNPKTVKGSATGSLGLSAGRKVSTFFGETKFSAKVAGNANGKITHGPAGFGLEFGNPAFTATANFSASFDSWLLGKKGSIAFDLTYPSGPSGSSIFGAQLLPTSTIVTYEDGVLASPAAAPNAEIGVTFSFDDRDFGTTNIYEFFGNAAVTNNTTQEGAPVIAESPDGKLIGLWRGDDGIVASHYDQVTGAWGETSIVTSAEGVDVRDLAVAFDGGGNAIAVWNEIDVSALTEDADFDQFFSVFESGGDLKYAVFDSSTGTWGAPLALDETVGRDHSMTLGQVDNGDVVMAYIVSVDQEASPDRLFAQRWDFSTQTWIAAELLAEDVITDAPALGLDGGTPVLVWSEEQSIPGAAEKVYQLESAVYVDGVWEILGVIDIPAAETPGVEELGVSLQTLDSIIASLPEPDKEECEEEEEEEDEDDEDDDDDEDDYEPDVVRPIDPNDIIGPDGFGEERWVAAGDAYDYKIRFENEPNATAPAQVVVITQELDPDLNFNSFRVDDFGWGGLVFEVEADSPFYQERFDFTEEFGWFVDVVASIDVQTGIATWTISTIDPDTGEPPLDAQAGFLPINGFVLDENGERIPVLDENGDQKTDDDGNPLFETDGVGEGFVTYTIEAGRRAETGDVVDAIASIVFDSEQPIITPPIFNTLDAEAPSSRVAALPERTETAEVLVQWAAEDPEGGSGLAGVDIFVSENGGDYTLWLANSTLTEAIFEGEIGSRYAFYSIARDNTGQTEAAPETFDATVAMGPQPGAIAGVVFEDADGDGARDEGETGLSGRIVFLDLDASGAFDNDDLAALTDDDGAYVFEGLLPGAYTVAHLLADGAVQTAPDGAFSEVTVVAGETTSGPTFGEFRLGSLSGVVYRDGIGSVDGARDEFEPGLFGWTVYIDANGSGAFDEGERSTETDATGAFSFDGLPAGEIILRVVVEDAYVLTAPEGGAHVATVTSGAIISGLAFGAAQPDGAIAGMQFEDLNGDGVKDDGERGLAGWTVYIDADGDGALDDGEASAVTDAEGRYVIADVPPGEYAVRAIAEAGFVQTLPGDGSIGVAGVTLNSTAADVALEAPSSISVEAIEALSRTQAGWDEVLTSIDDFRADTRFADIDGSGGAVVVIDTGIDADHPFFTEDGVSRIAFTFDFAEGDADVSDATGHGTGVAGVIAGADATHGGVAPGADIIVLKVYGDDGRGTFADLEKALQWVALNVETYNIGVVNLSLGDGGGWTEATSRYGLGDEFEALSRLGVITVAASGNSYADLAREGLAYPAADPNVLSVGAVWSGAFGGPFRFAGGATDYGTEADRIVSFTQRDAELLDVLAPGARVTTAADGGGLTTTQGTSHAAAYLSGVASLAQELALRELGRRLSLDEFGALVAQTATVVIDGDDEDDNVPNTGAAFARVDVLALAEAIIAIEPGDPIVVGEGDAGVGGDDPTPIAPSTQAQRVVVAPGETTEDVDFGFFELIDLGGAVIVDADGDGAADDGASPPAGVTVFLDANGNGLLDTGEAQTQTGADGAFGFSGVGPGDVTVAILPPSGFGLSASLPGSVTLATVSGVDALALRFAIAPAIVEPTVGSVTGRAFDDLDGDGVADAGEPGRAGVQVFIDVNADGALDDGDVLTTTAADGAYRFDDLDPGDYVVRAVSSDGDIGTLGAAGTAASVVAGETAADVDFGFFTLIALRGTVIVDADGDGEADAGADAPAGLTVFLDVDGDGALNDGEATALTDAAGAFVFQGVGPGIVTVVLIPSEAFDLSEALPGAIEITPISGGDRTDLLFGVAPIADAPTLVVETVAPTRDGFAVRFNDVVDGAALSVNGENPSIVLSREDGATLGGTIVIDDDEKGFRVFAAGEALDAGDYTVSLRSGDGAVNGPRGALDGDTDGVAGGDFTAGFTVAASDAPILGIADVVRGPGQDLAQPDTVDAAQGVPIRLTGAEGLTEIAFRLDYDADLMTVTDLELGADAPVGATLEADASIPGVVTATLRTGAPLGGGSLELLRLRGAVPADAPVGARQTLDLTVTSSVGVAQVADDDGVQVVERAGDLNRNGVYDRDDSRLALSRLRGGGGLSGGDGQTDGALIDDADGDGDFDLRDAMVIARRGAGAPTPPPTGNLLDLSARSTNFGLGARSGSSMGGLSLFSGRG